MQIEEILQGVECLRRSGASANVTGVEYDSRRVAPGSLFVAMQGETTDGNRYVRNAIDRARRPLSPTHQQLSTTSRLITRISQSPKLRTDATLSR